MERQIALRFDGQTFDPALDQQRLARLLGRVYTFMRDGEWRTLAEIACACGGTEASVSARLRDLRKGRYGAFDVQRRRASFRGVQSGLYEYRLDAREDRRA